MPLSRVAERKEPAVENRRCCGAASGAGGGGGRTRTGTILVLLDDGRGQLERDGRVYGGNVEFGYPRSGAAIADCLGWFV